MRSLWVTSPTHTPLLRGHKETLLRWSFTTPDPCTPRMQGYEVGGEAFRGSMQGIQKSHTQQQGSECFLCLFCCLERAPCVLTAVAVSDQSTLWLRL